MKTALILPAYNEGAHIEAVVSGAKKYVDVVYVVDDGSKDDTIEKAKRAGAITIKHPLNLGKAGALKTGIAAALKQNAEIIIFMDSDGQHLAEDLPRFIETIESGEADIVIGGRQGGDKMPFVRNVGNRMLEAATRILFGINVRDIQSGYRAFHAKQYPKLKWRSKNYHADAEMTVRAGKYGLKYKEIPIKTIYLDDVKGMDAIDGLKLLFNIILWRFSL